MYIVILNSLDDVIRPIRDHCKKLYSTENRHVTQFTFSEKLNFVNPLFAVHKKPKTKTKKELNSKVEAMRGGNIEDAKYFAHFTTTDDLSEILKFVDEEKLNVTILEGGPGMGKSMVATEIAHQWAIGNLLQNIQLLLVVHFRDPKVHTIEEFKHLIHHCYKDDNSVEKDYVHYFEKITHGKNLMMIFDGYDELPKQAKINTFFEDLLGGKILPQCKVFFTSRPYVTSHLLRYCNSRVEIMGFTKKVRYAFLQNKLSNENFQKIKEKFEQNTVIDSLCYIPLNMAVLIDTLEHNESIPETQTKFTDHCIRLTITHDIEKKSGFAKISEIRLQDENVKPVISPLAKLAYNMIDKGQLVFSEDEVKKAKLDLNEYPNAYGLLRLEVFMENGKQKKSYSFSHYSIQEYLAAYYLSQLSSIKQISVLHHMFWKGEYLGVWRMYTGITKDDQFALQIFLSNKSTICTIFNKYLGYGVPGISHKITNDKVKYLQLYHFMLEAPHSEISESLTAEFDCNHIDLSGINLYLKDIEVVSYYIARSYVTLEWTTINLSNCGINDHAIELFCNPLSLNDGRKKPTILFFNISGNNIRKLKTLVMLIQTVNISKLGASNTLRDMEHEQLQNLSDNENLFEDDPLELLDLSSNALISDDIIYICKILSRHRKLKDLHLQDNDIDDTAITTLMTAIIQWENFETIECMGNKFHDCNDTSNLLKFAIQLKKSITGNSVYYNHDLISIKHFFCVLEAANTLSTKSCTFALNVSKLRTVLLDCSKSFNSHETLALTNRAAEALTICHILTELNLSGISINKGAAVGLCTVFDNSKVTLHTIILNRCKLNSEAGIEIFKGLYKVKKLRNLELCDNLIDDEATNELSIAIVKWNSLQSLKIDNNKLSENSVNLLCLIIGENSKSPPNTLDFYNDSHNIKSLLSILGVSYENNKFANNFISMVSNIKELSLEVAPKHNLKCNEVDATNICHRFNNLCLLNISGIQTSEEAVEALLKSCTNSLQHLIMNHCGITTSMAIRFAKGIQKFKCIKELQLCHNSIGDEAIEHLTVAILQCSSLEILKLERNKLSESSQLLCKLLIENMQEDIIINFNCDFRSVKSFLIVLDYMNKSGHKTSRTFFLNILSAISLSMNIASNHKIELNANASSLLQHFKKLSSLNLSGISISEEISENLLRLFANNAKFFQCLILNKCCITSSTAINFANQLKYSKSIKEIQLCDNLIDNEAKKPLAVALLHWNSLNDGGFKINNNNIDVMLFQFIMSQLKCLDSSLNFDVLDDIKCFIKLLEYMNDVQSDKSCFVKYISNNTSSLSINKPLYCSKLYLTIEASCFFQRFGTLTFLIISGIIITEQAADKLTKAFATNLSSLKHLILNDCSITTAVTIRWLNELQKIRRFEKLQLCSNQVNDEATEPLAKAVLGWNCLKELKLTDNRLTSKCQDLLNLLTNDQPTKDIELSKNLNAVKTFISVIQYINCHTGGRHSNVFLSNIAHLKHLSLEITQCAISEVHRYLELPIKALEFLQRLNNLSLLNLSGIIIREKAGDTLANMLEGNLKYLQRLIMNGCQISSLVATKIAKVLQKSNIIEEIQLSNNHIDDNALKDFTLVIISCNLLKILKLNNNKFSEKSQQFFDLFTTDQLNLSSVNFKNCYHVIASFIAVIENINCNGTKTFASNVPNIKFFLLENVPSKVSEKVLELTANASQFFLSFSSLSYFNISGINIGKEVDNMLVRAFENNLHCLQYIMMNSCQITTLMTIKFAKMLQGAKGIKELQLCNNSIGDEATSELALAMLHWTSLERLKLSGNKFSGKCESVLDMLTIKKLVTKLDLSLDVNAIKSFIAVIEYISSGTTSKSSTLFLSNVLNTNFLSLEMSKYLVFTDSIHHVDLPLTVQSSHFFKELNHLTYLNFSGIAIGEEVAVVLNRSFGDNLKSLTHLIVKKCNITSHIIMRWSQNLQTIKEFKELQLNYNLINDEATEALCFAILNWNSLQTLNLGNNEFSEESQLLFNLLTKEQFKTSSIRFSTFHCIKSFVTVLRDAHLIDGKASGLFISNVSSITALSLHYNYRETTYQTLTLSQSASQIFSLFHQLFTLKIDGVCIDENACDIIIKAFDGKLKHIKCLVLNGCCLNSKMLIKLLFKLKYVNCIEEFQVCDNLIDDEATETLAIAILYWRSLKTLAITNNKFTSESKTLLNLLTKKRAETSSVDMGNNVNSVQAFITTLNYVSSTNEGMSTETFISNILDIKCLSLNVQAVGRQLVMHYNASMFFKRFNNLLFLNLSGIVLSNEAVDMFIAAFKGNLKSLQHLIMNNCCIESFTVIKWAEPLQHIKKIKDFQLCNNLIGDEATEALAIAILHWNDLDTIKVEQNKFSETAILLFNMISGHLQIDNLCFMCTGFNDSKSFAAVLDYVQEHNTKGCSHFKANMSKVTELCLTGGSLPAVANKKFLTGNASKLFQRFTSLVKMQILSVNLGEQVGGCLLKALAGLKCLLQIVLSNCYLSSSFAKRFGEEMQKCKQIRMVDLSNNQIGDEATESLSAALLQWNSLESIKLCNNNFSENSLLIFNLLTKREFKVQYVDFRNDVYNTKSFYTIVHYINASTNKSSKIFVSNISEIVHLSTVLQKEHLHKLKIDSSTFLRSSAMSKLVTLNLSGIFIGEESPDYSVNCNLLSLQYLKMNNCCIKSSVMIKILRGLHNAVNIKELHVSYNQIDDEATEAVAVAVLHWPLFELLHVKDNKFSEASKFIIDLLATEIDPETSIDFINDSKHVEVFTSILHYINELVRNNSANSKLCSQFLRNITKVSTLYLTCPEGYNLELTSSASMILSRFRNLKKLVISGITINDNVSLFSGEIHQPVDTTSTNYINLMDLAIRNCQMKSVKVIGQTQLLQNLGSFDISNNSITDEAVHQLVTSLIEMPRLEKLNTSGNCFNSHNMDTIFSLITAFRSSTSSIHYRDHCDDADDNVGSFLTILACMYTVISSGRMNQLIQNVMRISELSLHCLPYRTLNESTSSFFQHFTNLVVLDIIGIAIKSKDVENIAISFSSSLEQLKLNDCQIDDSFAEVILSHKKGNVHSTFKFLRQLDITSNHLSNKGIEKLVELLLQMRKLKSLKICDGNQFSSAHCKVFDFINDVTTTTTKQPLVVDFSSTDDAEDYVNAFIILLAGMINVSRADSRQVQHILNIKEINFNCLHFKTAPVLTKKACIILKQFAMLQKFNLFGFIIDYESAEMIGEALDELSSLKELVLCDCQLDSESVVTILTPNKEAVPSAYKVLVVIDVSNNHIGDEAKSALVASLLQMPNIVRVNIAGNSLSTELFNETFNLIVNCKQLLVKIGSYNASQFSSDIVYQRYIRLKDLNTVSCFLELLGSAKGISLKNSCQLQSISNIYSLQIILCNNEKGVNLTCDSALFFKRFSSLLELNISGVQIESKAVDIISEVLQKMSCTIEMITLSNCQVNSDGINQIISSLNKDKIKQLCLSSNEIHHEAADSIKSFTHNNSVLQWIDLSGNELNGEVFNTVATGIITCTNLHSLILTYNGITDDDSKVLSHMKSTLQLLEIEEGNFISKKVHDEFQHAIVNNQCVIS